jgi:hypothetical protein
MVKKYNLDVEEHNLLNEFQRNRRMSVGIFHSKCVIGGKLNHAPVMLKVKIMTFLKTISHQARPRSSLFFNFGRPIKIHNVNMPIFINRSKEP